MLRGQFGAGENSESGYDYLSKIYRMMEEGKKEYNFNIP